MMILHKEKKSAEQLKMWKYILFMYYEVNNCFGVSSPINDWHMFEKKNQVTPLTQKRQ